MIAGSTRVLARDVLVSMAVVIGLYALAEGLQFQPLQVPGYLLVVGFDVIERTFGAAGPYYHLWFGLYLATIGLVAAGVAQVIRPWTGEGLPGWRLAASSALAVIGVLAFGLAATVLAGAGQLAPVLILAAAGAILLGFAAIVGGLVDAV